MLTNYCFSQLMEIGPAGEAGVNVNHFVAMDIVCELEIAQTLPRNTKGNVALVLELKFRRVTLNHVQVLIAAKTFLAMKERSSLVAFCLVLVFVLLGKFSWQTAFA